MYICVCPNQDRRRITVILPTQLSKKWAKHIQDANPKPQYKYCVASAVRQAKSTPDHFLKCWNKYKRRANAKGKQHFLEDVYQRFCDADFANTKGDNSDSKLSFVLGILQENNGDDAEPRQVPSCECLCLLVIMRGVFSGMNARFNIAPSCTRTSSECSPDHGGYGGRSRAHTRHRTTGTKL